MKTLAIESTCDDTSLAIVSYNDDHFECEKMQTYSQWTHATYGGVVPELASRWHEQRIVDLVHEVMEWVSWDEISAITIAAQPWLPGSILVGITAAHTLWAIYNKPVIEVNHILWHVFSILLDRHIQILELPYLCLTVSGGHSDVYMIDKNTEEQKTNPEIGHDWWYHKRGHIWVWSSEYIWPYMITKIMQTKDDAAGEAFDKVAKMLWWPYPGWPWISLMAKEWRNNDLIAPRIRTIQAWDQFSFSWVKAQIYSLLEYLDQNDIVIDTQLLTDICHRFEDIMTDALVLALQNNIQKYQPKTIWVVGGVSANTTLMNKVHSLGSWLSHNIWTPAKMKYCWDNAAMIGVMWILQQLD